MFGSVLHGWINRGVRRSNLEIKEGFVDVFETVVLDYLDVVGIIVLSHCSQLEEKRKQETKGFPCSACSTCSTCRSSFLSMCAFFALLMFFTRAFALLISFLFSLSVLNVRRLRY